MILRIMTLKRWNRLSQKTIIRNDHWSYNLDEFEIEGGVKGEYHYVHTLGSTMIIPVTKNNKLLLVNQYRYLNQKESLEFPCGSVEPGLTETENALKELREETGFSSARLIKSGEFSPYTGASDEMCTVFIGLDLFKAPLPGDDTEEFILIEKSFSEIEQLIENNLIWDGLTLSAWIISRTLIKQHIDKT